MKLTSLYTDAEVKHRHHGNDGQCHAAETMGGTCHCHISKCCKSKYILITVNELQTVHRMWILVADLI